MEDQLRHVDVEELVLLLQFGLAHLALGRLDHDLQVLAHSRILFLGQPALELALRLPQRLPLPLQEFGPEIDDLLIKAGGAKARGGLRVESAP